MKTPKPIDFNYLGRKVSKKQPQKWISFCQFFLNAGYTVYVHEAVTTASKYIFICRGTSIYKVRFSNHKPNKDRESRKDCDFFVGRTNTGTTNTQQAIHATLTYFQKVA